MKTLEIEWRHLETEGQTCSRCAETGKTLTAIIEDMKQKCRECGVDVSFKEVLLGPNDLEQSNSIRFNGRLLEDVLAGVQVSGNCCPSCSELVGRDVTCRTIVYQGSQYESVPEELIWKAACKVGGCACVAEAERCC